MRIIYQDENDKAQTDLDKTIIRALLILTNKIEELGTKIKALDRKICKLEKEGKINETD